MNEVYGERKYWLGDQLPQPTTFKEACVEQPLPNCKGVIMYVRMPSPFVTKKVIHIRRAWNLGLEHFLVRRDHNCYKAFGVTHVHFLDLPNAEGNVLIDIADKLVSILNPPVPACKD